EASAVVITLVLVGKWLEGRAKRQTAAAIRALQALRPATAILKRGKNEIEVPIETIQSGDMVVVKPCKQIPVDGKIVAGSSLFVESMVSGERLHVVKQRDDNGSVGAMNGEGLLLIEHLAVGSQNPPARIKRIFQDAQAAKAPIQRSVDRVSAI